VDKQKFVDWLEIHSPFNYISGELVSLSSGHIADEAVNCEIAHKVGSTMMKGIIGQNFSSVKMRRKNKVRSQAVVEKGIKVRENIVTVNPEQLFHRIMCLSKGSEDLKRYFRHELASVPAALFDDVSLRKGTKSFLVPAFYPTTTQVVVLYQEQQLAWATLLHTVVWPRPATYNEIYNRYTSHVERLYGKNSTVVFNGYQDYPTTKGEEQRRRSIRETSCDIVYEDSMYTSTTQF